MFYVTPPSGNICLEKFHLAAISRLNFLVEKFLTCSKERPTGANYDVTWLVDGTPKDVVSHFLLRLACCDDPDLWSTFVSLETNLFRSRVSKMTEKDRIRLVVSARNQVGEVIDWNPRYVSGDKHVAVFCKLYAALSGFVSAWKASSPVPVLVPFDSVPSIVAERRVVLRNGEAVLESVSDQTEALCCLFNLALSSGLAALKSSTPKLARRGDDRIQAVTNAIRRSLSMKLALKRPAEVSVDQKLLPTVLASQVDFLARKTFPPCMQNLHRRLRSTHRLRHHGRIQYTLFLKEIGMPFEEALTFWREEYSKPEGLDHDCRNGSVHPHAKCGHSWQLNSKKFVASLNGLYGKSGSRINYYAHSCSSLQRALLSSSSDVGGCAFVHSDDPALKKYYVDVDSVGEDALTPSDFISPSAACSNCLTERLVDIEDVVDTKKQKRSEEGCTGNTRFTKPSQFYALVRKRLKGENR